MKRTSSIATSALLFVCVLLSNSISLGQFVTSIDSSRQSSDGVLNIVLRNPGITNIILTNKYEIATNLDFHTDVRVLGFLDYVETDTNMVLVRAIGKVGFAVGDGGRLNRIAGLPGTKLNISTITNELIYANVGWTPRSTNQAMIICTTNQIIGINVSTRKLTTK
jgi:hypothetical protein